jgi:exoribonuclease R
MEQVLIVKKRYGSFDSFEGAKLANKCLLFDKVLMYNDGCSLIERAEHPRLIGILYTTGPKYGYTSRQHPIYLCKPLDPMYPPFYVGSKIIDNLRNKLIIFQFDSWPENSEFPKGRFIDFHGDCGDVEAEKNSVLDNASPYSWPKKIPEIIKPSFENRMKLSGYTFNIDPEGCKDVDDCITMWDNAIAISIADVSAWVRVNPWLQFAEKIGTSLYENGACIKPMFPTILSEDYMSLIEGEERLAYSLIIIFGETISYKFQETIVKVDKSYTYDSVHKDTEFNTYMLKEYIYRLTGIITNDSHKWIEVLMLTYNSRAGEVLKEKNRGILRAQKGLSLERSKLFDKFGSDYMYLCYESAKYCLPSNDTNHSMLNISAYAHASSPIRRYVDIINQFALKSEEFSYGNIERFNIQQKKAKEFERELIYIDLYENKKLLDGIILDGEKIFIPFLKKIIKYNNLLEVGKKVQLQYYMNPQGIRWKDRIVYQIKCVNTNFLE